MIPVKLSEVKVGDQVYDMETNLIGMQSLLEVEKITWKSVYMKFISGQPYPFDEISFSLFTEELFYKPAQSTAQVWGLVAGLNRLKIELSEANQNF
jgi:hypothetical protein